MDSQFTSPLAQISQLRNQDIRDRAHLVSAIEVVNDEGLNVVEIDGTLYVYTEFVRPDDGIFDIEVVGRNVTTILSNQLETHGLNPQAITALLQAIDAVPERRRRFHRNVTWREYLAKGSH